MDDTMLARDAAICVKNKRHLTTQRHHAAECPAIVGPSSALPGVDSRLMHGVGRAPAYRDSTTTCGMWDGGEAICYLAYQHEGDHLWRGPHGQLLPPDRHPGEAVDHPPHYGGADDPYEAIKVIEAWGLGFCLGNALKYLSRAGKKGDRLEDLRKARWYIDREIQREEVR